MLRTLAHTWQNMHCDYLCEVSNGFKLVHRRTTLSF